MCMLIGQAVSYADVRAQYLAVVKQLKKGGGETVKDGFRTTMRITMESHANCGTEKVSKWLLTYMASNCFIKK